MAQVTIHRQRFSGSPQSMCGNPGPVTVKGQRGWEPNCAKCEEKESQLRAKYGITVMDANWL